MTLVRTATIPSEFIRFDTYVTDADSFNNVRDFQVARENLNVLVARRLRHPLLAHRFRRDGYTTEGQYIYGYGPLGSGTQQQNGYWLGPWRIWIPPFCKALTIRLRASMDTASGDALVYPCLGVTGPNAGYLLTVTGVALAEYEIDIPTPSSYSGGPYFADLRAYVTCESYGADLKGGGGFTVDFAGQESNGSGFHGVVATKTATLAGYLNSLIYFTSPANVIEPQAIIDTDTVTIDGSLYYRAHVGRVWNRIPANGDTFDARALAAFIPHTLTVVPKAITDFGTLPGLT